MISIKEAEKILASIPVRPALEAESIHGTLNRILGQDIRSEIDMPPFNKSAMDGYALNADDKSDRFRILEVIPAGVIPLQKIGAGQCAKIMTGGVVPEGANRVVKREVTIEEEGYMRIVGEDPTMNICFRGEDVRTGDVLLRKGTRIGPSEIGVVASMGLSRVLVYKRPVVGILVTGSELVAPGKPLEPGRIYDSNSYSLRGQVESMGGIAESAGIVLDSQDGIRSALDSLLASCDLVILSGGVSAGDFDYVPGILKKLGFKLHFEKLAIKPGKPTVFATREDAVVFGVPGNPVSTFVIFEVFVKPFLYRMMGHDYYPEIIQGKMAQDFRRKQSSRSAYIPVRHQKALVEILPYHGSAHFHALTRANGLLCVPEGENKIAKGSLVDVRSIQ
ncbi:MAG: hypothetical protein GQ536_01855 [Candidatus Aminicenantes bacterium]|nr:hypothetical protein [Candidatus Aminicenantes bacterium]